LVYLAGLVIGKDTMAIGHGNGNQGRSPLMIKLPPFRVWKKGHVVQRRSKNGFSTTTDCLLTIATRSMLLARARLS